MAASSSSYVDAQLAVVDILLQVNTGLEPIKRAAQIVEALGLDPSRRAQLVAEVLESGLPFLTSHRNGTVHGAVFGHELTEKGVRHALERAYRDLARHAPTKGERIALVERANQVRSRSWW